MTVEELAERLDRETTLSAREAEVVAYRVEGHSWGELGAELGIERGTAQTYYQRAKEKARRATQTAETLQEVGFIDP